VYKVIWDREINGILLTDNVSLAQEIIPPRPVFYEELDLLNLNNFWTYPKVDEPLLWAIGRRYYYRGELVAIAKGGDIFTAPKIELTNKDKNLVLEPVNMELMIEKNRPAIEVLENEAIDFVEHTYRRYKDRVDYFIASFSGGKDSSAVLDIVSRTLPPDEYIVVFTDTTMEIPSTYEAYERTKDYYQNLYPGLKFYVARNEQHSLDLWKKFGPPSMMLRWCCSVYKTSPQVRLIKRLTEKNRSKILIFDGVRSEESLKRMNYLRIAESVKHINQINAEVIRDWNISEVFIYLFARNLPINKGYRYGLNRVGCGICPFGSNWYEFIINSLYPTFTARYLEIIEDFVKILGIEDQEKIKEYISQGQWKKRGGGEGVDTDGRGIDFIEKDSQLEAILTNPREDFKEWIKPFGKVSFKNDRKNTYVEVNSDGRSFGVTIEPDDLKERFKFTTRGLNDILTSGRFKKILYKTEYCVHCGVCEAECPNSAIRVVPDVKINVNLCSHCLRCIDFVDRGCLVAKSLAMVKGGNMNSNDKKKGFGRYLRFGMRGEWLSAYLSDPDNWFSNNNLGNKQVAAMVQWLRDGELLTLKNTPTELCSVLKEIFLKDKLLAWEIVWINLFYNSGVINWYIKEIPWGAKLSSKELKELVLKKYNDISERTASSGIDALLNTFDTTPYGNTLMLGLIEKDGNIRYVKKIGTNDVHPLAIVYSLYRYANNNRYNLTVSELYKDNVNGGPFLLFGVSREDLENSLRWLQEKRYLRIDLKADLDNIHLREDIPLLELLKREP